MVGEEASVKDIGFAAGGTGEEGVDDGGATAPSEKNRHVISAGGLDAIAKVFLIDDLIGGGDFCKDAECPSLGGKQLWPFGGELALFATNLADAFLRLVNPDDSNLDKAAVSVDADAVWEDDLGKAGILRERALAGAGR
jgi:hypothetical protein